MATVDKRACEAADPKATHLMNGGTIPGNNAAAVAAVLAFRQSNTWPFGAAHIDDPRTAIDSQTRNGHVIVAILDYKTLFMPNLDCSSEEWYRVDVRTFDVKPFDGCGANTPANHPLPILKDLPD